jgi:hypothetical protein
MTKVARGLVNAAPKRRSLSHILGLQNDPNLRMLGLQLG